MKQKKKKATKKINDFDVITNVVENELRSDIIQLPNKTHTDISLNGKRPRDELTRLNEQQAKSYNDFCFDTKGKRRGKLPDNAILVLRNWLFRNSVCPYPTEDEKLQLISETGLSLVQVNNWFSNARRRILRKVGTKKKQKISPQQSKSLFQSQQPSSSN